MKTKRLMALAFVLALVGTMGWADWVENALTVTATSQTITFTDYGVMGVWVKNAGTTNEVFVCPWRNDQTPAACTTTTGRRLDPGEAKSWTANPDKGQYWQAISFICSTAESTTVWGDSLP